MTTRDEARRATGELRTDVRGRPVEAVGGASGASSAVPSLPERLYAARERKGVDLYRAERDTKIRARYLGALERGDYRELPGAVYTKGFLRNYALYLGLDPEEILGQWRRERGDVGPATPVIVVPRPISAPRKGLAFSPGVVVAALLTVLIFAVGAYLTVQVMRFAKPPTLAITAPREATLEVDEDTEAYILRGTSIAGATITIEATGGTQQVKAGSDGTWSADVELRRGRNEFRIDAVDPDTGKHSEQVAHVIIVVPAREIESPTLTVEQPTDGTTFENGAIPVQGRVANATDVSISAAYEGPIEGAPVIPNASPPAAPAPVAVEVEEDGSFTAPIQLTAGRWEITVTATGAGNRRASQTRHVSVGFKGVNLVVEIKGGNAWVKVWVDGKVADPPGAAGDTYRDGETLTFTGQQAIEVRTGSSGATFFTLNGQSLGALGRRGVPETWLFQPPAAPTSTQRR